MVRLNLLPWRIERRKQRQKEFTTVLAGAAAMGIAIVMAASMYFEGQIEGQVGRNDYLKGRIAEVEGQIKEIEGLETRRASLLQRKQVIETLQADRSQNVRLFEELVRTIPDGVKLITIKQNGAELTLTGRSQSESRVSAYMRNLEQSGLISNPKLTVIKVGDADAAAGGPAAAAGAAADRTLPFGFAMTVTLRAANAEEPAEAGSGATPSNVPSPAPAA